MSAEKLKNLGLEIANAQPIDWEGFSPNAKQEKMTGFTSCFSNCLSCR